MSTRRKLIEVSLPLEAINVEAAREKSIRYGHPSTLHLWWARRPLAAARAVLFAQLVDDPSSNDDDYRAEAQRRGIPADRIDGYIEGRVTAERERLHEIIRKLVVWENINDEALYREARDKILKSTGGNPPPILDPFAGGGTIPLEAQRLGLEAHASDLNPVAVLINKALIEIPPIRRSCTRLPRRRRLKARRVAQSHRPRRRRPTLRRMDARRSRKTNRPSVPRSHPPGSFEGQGHRLDLGAHRHLSEPCLQRRGPAYQ